MLGGVLASPGGLPEGSRNLTSKDVDKLEIWEKELMDRMSLDGVFVKPGANLLSAHAHVARTLTRRLERRLVTAIREHLRQELVSSQNYINRLSDLLYLLGRKWEGAGTGKREEKA